MVSKKKIKKKIRTSTTQNWAGLKTELFELCASKISCNFDNAENNNSSDNKTYYFETLLPLGLVLFCDTDKK